MRNGARIVWGISYAVKSRSGGWTKWVGPCGIYGMKFTVEFPLIFVGRPLFFRTRQLARDDIARHTNINKQTKYRVEKYKLSWMGL